MDTGRLRKMTKFDHVNSKQQDLIWRQVQPGRWERGIDEAEEYYASLANLYESTGQMYFALTGHVSIRYSVPTHSDTIKSQLHLDNGIRAAWLAVRRCHPTIASRVEWNADQGRFVKVYETTTRQTSNQTSEDWLQETLHTTTEFHTGQDLLNSGLPAPTYCSLYVVKPKETVIGQCPEQIRRDLVLRLPHDIIDGMGTFHLMNELLKHVSQGLEHPYPMLTKTRVKPGKLVPPMKLALGTPRGSRHSTKKLCDEIALENEKLDQGAQTMILPFSQGTMIPGRTQRIEIAISPEDTRTILSACKEQATTVTHAFHTAAIIALGRLQQRGSSARTLRYLGSGWINLRDKCQAPYNSAAYAPAVYHAASPHLLAVDMKIPPANSCAVTTAAQNDNVPEFTRVLQTVQDFYYQFRTDKDLARISPQIWRRETPPRHPDPSYPLPPPPPNPTPSVFLSSMGNLDKVIEHTYGPLEVHEPWVVGDELDTGMGLFLTSFRGRINLCATFNEAWHDLEQGERFLRDCRAVMEEGLGIVAM